MPSSPSSCIFLEPSCLFRKQKWRHSCRHSRSLFISMAIPLPAFRPVLCASALSYQLRSFRPNCIWVRLRRVPHIRSVLGAFGVPRELCSNGVLLFRRVKKWRHPCRHSRSSSISRAIPLPASRLFHFQPLHIVRLALAEDEEQAVANEFLMNNLVAATLYISRDCL